MHAAQANWVSAIKTISEVYFEGGDFVGTAATAAGELYGYGKTNVLFKPTKATDHPFRPTAEEAMSYFVGAEAMNNDEFKGAAPALHPHPFSLLPRTRDPIPSTCPNPRPHLNQVRTRASLSTAATAGRRSCSATTRSSATARLPTLTFSST